MNITIKDIAREAGVSIATVSLVLRNDPNLRIRSDTRQRIIDTAKSLKYRHNMHARALRMGKSELIGVLMFDLGTRIAISKQEAINREIWLKGYRSLLQSAGGHMDMELRFIQEYASSAVEGVIIVQPTRVLTAEALEPLIERTIPVISLEKIEGAQIDCVTVDRQYGAYIAIKHLLDIGHRRIGLLHYSTEDPFTVPRVLGYRQAMAEYDIKIDGSLLVRSGSGYLGGYEAMRTLLDMNTGATAVFCNNDEIAMGAMRAVQKVGLRIPEDIAIVGFDNIAAGEYAPVPITTVAQPVDELAEKVVELLFKRMESSEGQITPQTISLKPHLVIRESCGGAKS